MLRLVLFLTAAAVLGGCATLRLADQTEGLPPEIHLASVPFHPQTEYHCGPAALATVLEHSGRNVDVDELAARVYTPGLRGSLQAELVATARSQGRVVYRLPGEPRAVLAQVAAGRPVLVLENHGLESRPYWHYAVVVGYDRNGNQMLLRSGTEREQRVSAGRWLRRWDRAGRWAVVLVRPGEWPAEPEPERWITAAADFEAASPPQQAAQVWDQTVARWPDQPLAWLGVGNTAFARGDLDAAEQAYRRLLALEPAHPTGHFNLAVVLEQIGLACEAAGRLQALVGHEALGERAEQRLDGLARDCPDAD